MSGDSVQRSAFADNQFGNILLQSISMNAKRYYKSVIGEC
jgi:hypothetical protein